jgi:hypothetical protein
VSVEEIRDLQGNLLCVHSKHLIGDKVTDFWNLDNSALELGLMHRGPSNPVDLHRHSMRLSPRSFRTHEVLIQLDGKMVISIFTDEGRFVREIESFGKSITLFIQGAHKIDFPVLTNIIEIKNGPFQGEKDKVWIKEKPS